MGSATAVAYGTHQVKQLYYTSADCTGTPTETDGISGEKGCFTTSQGFQSENIICDPNNAANNAVVADGTHQVKQLYYASGDCIGTPTETDGISGDNGCFTTSQGFQSENIICDPNNAAMHVTLYKDGQCSDSQVLNAFSIASNSCHREPTFGGSFSWACYSAAS